jgi:Family of unknown function (DUF6064)
MPDWWSYTLSDFLLFSPRAYYRLIERYNAAVWPVHILALGLGITALALLRRPTPTRGRAIALILSLLWIWVAVAFVWSRYTTINWAARYVLPLFAIEVLLLVWLGVVRQQLRFYPRNDLAGRIGTGLLVFSLVLYPALAPLLGRGWHQAEVFGMVPDPTAVGTLGLLLLIEGRPSWSLMVVPALWCLVAGVTLLAMGSFDAWIPPLAAILTLGLAGPSRIKQPRDSQHQLPWS